MEPVLRGRKRKYAEYDELLQNLPKVMKKRPRYINGVGVFRGARNLTAWIKISLPHGGVFQGKSYPKRGALEIKLGNLSSWSWSDLEEKYREVQGRADRGEALEDTQDILFREFAEDWLNRAQARVKGYGILKGHVHTHLIPVFGCKSLHEINVADINRWQSSQLRNLAPGTVKRQFNTLNACFNDAIRSGFIEKNPCNGTDKIRGIRARQRFLDGNEILTLLSAAEREADWLYDFILWQLHSGMRKGETLSLHWSHIKELPNGTIIAQLNETKSDVGRQVPCTKTMCEIVLRQKQRSKEDSRFFPYARITVDRKWKKIRSSSGLTDIVLNDLRRTHSTHAMTAGVDPRTLAGRIGHSDLTMLQKHYAALVGSAAEEAAEKIEASFSPKNLN